MSSNMVWTWEDGWILMAIYCAANEDGAELSEIISVADATNHAIPMTSELSSAMTKFVQCGLISVVDNRYHIAKHFLPAVRKAFEGRGGLFSSGDKGHRLLKRTKAPPDQTLRVELTEAEVTTAYRNYMNRYSTRGNRD
jgi:hypothetical protein